MNTVGQSVPRTDTDKVTGGAAFVADLPLVPLAHAAVVRSPHPHARITAIRIEPAIRLPGVRAILTGADLCVEGKPLRFGPIIRDQPILAWPKVRFAGEAVAAVAAEDPLTAHEAAERINVDYEPLPAVLFAEEAIAPGAPRIHEDLEQSKLYADLGGIQPDPARNLANVFHFSQGNAAIALQNAPVQSGGRYTLPAVHHYPLEPQATTAHWRLEGLTVWSSNHAPFFLRGELARLFGFSPEQVHLRVPYLGGGFGAKAYVTVEPLVVALSRAARMPVRLVCSASEVFTLLHTRHGADVDIRLGANADGQLLAAQICCRYDTGAYTDTGPRVAQKAGGTALGPYWVPHLEIESTAVYTNKVSAGAYRGYGVAQTAWAMEQQLNELARQLHLDPIELRLRNLPDAGHTIYTDGAGIRESARRCLVRVRELLPRGEAGSSGYGVALALKATVTPSRSEARIRFAVDGFTIYSGTIEKGQGAHTVFRQIVAETIHVPLSRAHIAPFDSDHTPYDQMTGSSRSTFSMGGALLAAARDLQDKMRAMGGDALGLPPHRVTLNGEYVSDARGQPIECRSWRHCAMPASTRCGVRGHSIPRMHTWKERGGSLQRFGPSQRAVPRQRLMRRRGKSGWCAM
jgi:carbon-monoxide dehydrogenase large subunit